MEAIVQEEISMRRAGALGALAALLSWGALPAAAATYDYAGSLASLLVSSDAAYPALGTPGTVSITIDDSDPSAALRDPDTFEYAQVMSATVLVPGYFFGALDYDGPQGDPYALSALFDGMQQTGIRLGSFYGPSEVFQPGGTGFFAQGLHYMDVTFGAPVSPLETVGDLIAAFAIPGLSGQFKWEGDIQGGGFDFATVSFGDAPTPVVPLPAAGFLLAGGLGGLAVLRRRRA